jgi:molecular chaperone HtpG
LNEEQQKQLTPVFEKAVDKTKFHIVFESLGAGDLPVMITQPEFMRRMKDMSALGGYNFMGNLPDSYNLVINSNHPLIMQILEMKDEDQQDKLSRQLIDLALLSQNLLKGEALSGFIKRSVDIIK